MGLPRNDARSCSKIRLDDLYHCSNSQYVVVSILLVLQNPRAHNFLIWELGGVPPPKPPCITGGLRPPRPPAKMYYVHSSGMYYDHSTCMYYDHTMVIVGGAAPQYCRGGARRPNVEITLLNCCRK